MALDISALIGAVTRRVESRDWQGKPARVVVSERAYAGAIEEVWDAMTRPERIRRWFLPVSGELRPGGRYQLEGNAGGTITECEPPRRLAVTWEYGGGIGWVNVTLAKEAEGRTRLVLEHIAHEGPEFDGFWEQFGPGAVGVGWDLALLGLDQHLATDGADVRRDEATWLLQGEGREFAMASSTAWEQASIRFGTAPDAAQAAAARTTDFYTGGAGGD